jgi:hypothetical protein
MIERLIPFVLLGCSLLNIQYLVAEPVPVRHVEGLVHGFLLLRTLDGKTIAQGDLTEIANGEQVTAHLVFHFTDGSLHEETAVFSQSHIFHLLKDHLVQKGSTFKHPLDMSIDTEKREVTVRHTDIDGKEKTTTEQMDLPADLANGMTLTVVKNVLPTEPKTTVSMIAATPRPRLVHLVITPAGEESFSIGDSRRKAVRYEVKVEVGGVSGLVAHLLGKLPPPTHVWIHHGDAPAFVKSEGPMCVDCPVWRIELTTPVWSAATERPQQ